MLWHCKDSWQHGGFAVTPSLRVIQGTQYDYGDQYQSVQLNDAEESRMLWSAEYKNFWIPDRDRQGLLYDRRFVQAAFALAPNFYRYRANQLDQALVPEVAERCVGRATRTKGAEPDVDPKPYLYVSYCHEADKVIERDRRLAPTADAELEWAAERAVSSSNMRLDWMRPVDHAERIERQVEMRQVRDQATPEEREVWTLLQAGFQQTEAAEILGITPQAFSARKQSMVARLAAKLRIRNTK